MTSAPGTLKIDSVGLIRDLVTRYAHVPLGAASLLLVLALIVWLVGRQLAGLWAPALQVARPIPAAVSIALAPVDAAGSSPPSAPAPTPATPEVRPAPPRMPEPAVETPERYVLESGPFASAEAADRLEERLNGLGYATVRFRKQDVRRLYVVAATGFADLAAATRAAADLRGSAAETEDGAEVVLGRFASLGEAVAAARPARARGLPVRIDAEPVPMPIYHVRYGQFDSRAAARSRAEELALFGIQNRIVRVR